MNQRLLSILNQFKNKKILVIGDVMLDKYIWGSVTRISPEAPVQIVKVEKESYAPGGASNVANNITALNANVFMVGIVGNDDANNILNNELKKKGINTEGIVVDEKKPTIQKIRVLSQNQQLIRVDYEKLDYEDKIIEKNIINNIKKLINNVDAIIISDYAKGVITNDVIKNTIETAKKNNKIIIIDPKPKHMRFYKNVTLVTPNHKEASEMSNIAEKNDEDLIKIGKKLLKDLESPLLITRGEKGMTLFEKDGKITNIPTKAKEVYDVTGAGDTVVAAVTLSLASGANVKEAAAIANYAAGIVVGKVGTSTASIDELKNSLEDE